MTFLKGPQGRSRRLTFTGISLALFTTLGAVAASGCGQAGNQLDLACQSEAYAELCGTSCDTDNDCASGLHCNFGSCLASCIVDNEAYTCNDGNSCDADGRCHGDGSSSLNPDNPLVGDDGLGGAGGSPACGDIAISFKPQIPTVMLLIDQSISMNRDFNGQQRWDAVYEALMDPNEGVVKTLEDKARFGLALYSYDGDNAATCPQLIESAPPALGQHAAIDALYAQQGLSVHTPTGASIKAITPELEAIDEPGPKLIILATDGNPDRCGNPDDHGAASEKLATDATQEAHAKGIQTVIIAVGDEVDDDHQQDMANAGQGLPVPAGSCADPDQCAPTYEPNSKEALISTFTDIINGQRSCVFQLDGAVIEGRECDGRVKVNGQKLACNDGWQLNNPREIMFLGDACNTILTDPNATIAATFPCGAISEAPR